MRLYLLPNLIISLVMLSSACCALAQTADRPPKLEAAALEIINTHLLSGANCWSQEFPPAMMLQMKAMAGLDPSVHFTVRWQPSKGFVIQGQTSLLRCAEFMQKLHPGTPLYDASEFQVLLEPMLPDMVGQLRKAAESALNLFNITNMSVNGSSPMVELFLTDPLGLAESGLADFETDPDAAGLSLVVTGISGGPWQGEQIKFYYSDASPCFNRIVTTNAHISFDVDLIWEARDQVHLPVYMEIHSDGGVKSDPVTIATKMTFQKIDGRWLPEKWLVDGPDTGEVVYLEVLAAYTNPDFSGFDWEDKLVFVDADALDEKLDNEFKASLRRFRQGDK